MPPTKATSPAIPLPANLSIKLPADVAAILHRLAYETGRTKHDLVIEAIRSTYGETSSS